MHGWTVSQPLSNAFVTRFWSRNFSLSFLRTRLKTKREKTSSLKFEGILSPNSIENQKKEVFTAIWHYLRPGFKIYWCSQPLFRLIIQTLSLLLVESAEISMGGTLTLHGDAFPLQFKYWFYLGKKHFVQVVVHVFSW